MPLFKLQTRSAPILVVFAQAACLSCARQVAAETAGAEGPRTWRDPDLSSVELVRDNGRRTLIFRGVPDGQSA